MVSKANCTGFINVIMKCILVTILIGASHVPSLLFSVSCLSMLMSDASIAFVVVVPLYLQH
jgi:hypothetical protein